MDHQNNILPTAQNCIFCQAEEDLILFDSKNFQVIFDKFPLTEGHLIVHSKWHWGCAGEIPTEYFQELIEIKSRVKKLLKEVYGSTILYEHGRIGHCISHGIEERLCHHFHLHFLPVCTPLPLMTSDKFIPIPLNHFDQLPNMFQCFGEYLFFEDHLGNASFLAPKSDIPSHFMRTLVADAIGASERSNWEDYPKTDLLENGRNKLCKKFQMRKKNILHTCHV